MCVCIIYTYIHILYTHTHLYIHIGMDMPLYVYFPIANMQDLPALGCHPPFSKVVEAARAAQSLRQPAQRHRDPRKTKEVHVNMYIL